MRYNHATMKSIGRTRRVIADGYIRLHTRTKSRTAAQLISHETVCLLNAGDQDAEIAITVFFSDREPAGPFRVGLPARRTFQGASPRS